MLTPKKLFVVDAMAMAFRNFHAFGQNQLKTSKGLPTSAVYGSAVFLLKLIHDEAPDYIVVACDSQEKTFRHELYPQYKANRTQMPEELSCQLPYLFKLFHALKLPLLKFPGFEADDLIGSLVRKYAQDNLHCYIVSGDKDFLQLVGGNVSLYSPKKGGELQILGTQGVYDKFGCSPEQVIDILALIGDTSDHVPGVPGIGEKGAAKLLQEYKSLAGIYENLDSITNKKTYNALSQNRELAYLSRQLVTIKSDIPLQLTLDDIACPRGAFSQKLADLLTELEFFTLKKKLKFQEEDKVKPQMEKTQRPYFCVRTQKEWNDFKTKLNNAKSFSFDTETTGLNVISSVPIGISFSFFEVEAETNQSYYIPLLHKHLEGISPEAILKDLRSILGDETKLKIAQNLKFDFQMLRNVGVDVKAPFFDTMLAAFLLDSDDKSYSLDELSLKHLGVQKIPTSTLIGGPDKPASMADCELEDLTEYACEDVDCCLRLYKIFDDQLQVLQLRPIADSIEMPLATILGEMEQTGILIDKNRLDELSIQLRERAQTLEQAICEMAGETFNLNSPKQLQVILFEKLKIHEQLGITRIKKTQSGYSTDVSVLENLRAHPIIDKLLLYRTLTKLRSTYTETLPLQIHPKTGRIHTSFLQTGAATGRLSSHSPNLQNIPIRKEEGQAIRAAFIAKPGYVLISADYSQIELRILAHLSKDTNLRAAFTSGEDIHTKTAQLMFKTANVTSEERSKAKAINYGIIYGMGPQRLAKTTGVSNKDAKGFIDNYFEAFPQVKTYIDSLKQYAEDHGFVKTLMGRRRFIRGLKSDNPMVVSNAKNMAVNSPIQGTQADLIKLAMIKIHAAIPSNLDLKMLLQVHDELVFECLAAHVEEASHLIKTCMESAMQLDIPALVEIGSGANWLEAH